MKKILTCVIVVLLTACLIAPVSAFAPPLKERIDLPNGYAIITTVIEEPNMTPHSLSSTRSASKIFRAYNFFDELLWTYTLTGEFTYDGNQATATRAYDSYSISDSAWSMGYSDTSCLGDTVYGDATFSCITDEQSCSLSITCDPDGGIS